MQYMTSVFANNMCMFGAGEVESTVKFHLKSFLKETFESFLKQHCLKKLCGRKSFFKSHPFQSFLKHKISQSLITLVM